MSAAIGLSDGNAQVADEGARAADTVANAAMTQADPRNLYREGKAVADRLPAGRARRRMARWDAKSKKALAKQDKVLDQLEHKRKRADTMRRAGMSDKSLLGRWINLRQKRLENKAGRLGAKAGRLAGTNTSGIRGKLMQLRRTKATVTNTVFGLARRGRGRGAAVGGTAVICLVGMSLLSAVIGGAATSSSGGSAEGYLAQAQRYVDDDSIGYSQSTRCHNPNMDCSSFVYYCLVDSGYCTTEQLGTYPFSTSTMAEPLLKAGFEKVEWDGKMDSLQRGDILVNTEQHTEIYAGDGKDYGAHEDLDGADGDSSGDEVSLGSYWNDAWDTILRPTGGAGVTIPEQYGNGGYSVTFYTPRGCYVNGRDTAWAAGTSQAAVHSKWSLAGAKYDDDIATYNGRYLIACTTTYGRVGDQGRLHAVGRHRDQVRHRRREEPQRPGMQQVGALERPERHRVRGGQVALLQERQPRQLELEGRMGRQARLLVRQQRQHPLAHRMKGKANMNMTDRFNPANENDPKRKLAYGLIALACVIALGFGLDAASCSRTGTAGDEGGKQDATEAVDGGSAAGATSQDGKEAGDEKKVEASPDPSRDLRRSVRGLRQALGHDRDQARELLRRRGLDHARQRLRARRDHGLDQEEAPGHR